MDLRDFLKTTATLVLLSLAAACGEPAEPVVGVIIPETGRAARYGAPIREGMDLAVEEVNAAGGVTGKPMRLIYKDSATDPDIGVAAARQLISEDKVRAIIGAVSSSVTARIVDEVIDSAQTVLLSPAASSPNLTDRSPYFFRVYPSDTFEGARMAELISSDLRLRKLVVFAVIDEYGAGYKKGLIGRYRAKKNREVLKVFNYAPEQSDFSAMVAETIQLQPEAIFLIGYVDRIADLVKTLRGAGITTPIFSSGSITPEFPTLAGEAAEGVVFSRPDFRMIGNAAQVSRFIAAYTARYGHEPGDYAAYGYDAVKILAAAIADNETAGAGIHLALRTPTTDYRGVTGNIVFGSAGGDVVASPTTYIIHQGQVVTYKDYLEQGGTPPGSRDGSGS